MLMKFKTAIKELYSFMCSPHSILFKRFVFQKLQRSSLYRKDGFYNTTAQIYCYLHIFTFILFSSSSSLHAEHQDDHSSKTTHEEIAHENEAHQASHAAKTAEKEKSSEESIDVVLLVDTSGSMRSTDPKKLRIEGGKLFTKFLKKNDRFAIIGFSNTTAILQPLINYDPVETEKYDAVINTLGDDGTYTNILAAINQGYSLLQNSSASKKIMVVLSDGKMDPDPQTMSSSAASKTLLEETLPEVREKGISIYTLAFSDMVDKDLLNEIAVATDGLQLYTQSVEEIHQSFADLFLSIKKPQVLPLTKKGFSIDAGIDEATFYVNKLGTQVGAEITDPEGKTFNAQNKPGNIKWFSSDKFEVITVQEPIEGMWQIAGFSQESGFATVLTDLKLNVEWPTHVYAEEKNVLKARIFDEDKPVTLDEMSEVLQIVFQITATDKVADPLMRDALNDSGAEGDSVADDKVYSRMLSIAEPGEYRLRVIAKSPTFQREQNIPFRVMPPVIQMQLEEKMNEADEHDTAGSESSGHGHNGHGDHHEHEVDPNAEYILGVYLSEETKTFKGTKVEVTAIDSQNNIFIIPTSEDHHNKQRLKADFEGLAEGSYRFKAVLKAKNKKGEEVQFQSKSIEHNVKMVNEMEGPPKIIKVVKKEKKKVSTLAMMIPYLLILGIVNIALSFALLRYVTKKIATVKMELPNIELTQELQDYIQKLRVKSAETMVDYSKF
jgi:Mg-chelatase subunit ChlD